MSGLQTSPHFLLKHIYLTALLVNAALLLQFPVAATLATDTRLALLNIGCHSLLMSAIARRCQLTTRINLCRGLLCAGFGSFIVMSTLIWEADVYTPHFLLLGAVACGFLFRQSETRLQWLTTSSFILLFLLLESQFIVVSDEPFNEVRLANALSLSAASLVVSFTFGQINQQRWEHVRTTYLSSQRLLNRHRPGLPFDHQCLRRGETRRVDTMCVLFADLAGFQQMNEHFDDEKTIAVLNTLYSEFDRLADHYGISRLKTNGDEYMAISSSVSSSSAAEHCSAMVFFASALLTAFRHLALTLALPCKIRVGIACGPVTAGIIGHHGHMTDIWGKTVNFASLLEHASPGNGILTCIRTGSVLSDFAEFTLLPVCVTTKYGQTQAYQLIAVAATRQASHNKGHSPV